MRSITRDGHRLDPADIVVNLHHAYRRPKFRDRHYLVSRRPLRGCGYRRCIDPRRAARALAFRTADRASTRQSHPLKQEQTHMVDNLQSQAVTGSAIKSVGVVGLGHMGHAFAVNLVEDGHQVVVYDRDPERTAAVSGARAAGQLTDLAVCDVVVTSLPDDDALAAVALGPLGLAGILAPNAVHISASTVSPTMSRRVAEEHARYRQGYVAAPVLGNPDFAQKRELFVLAAGLPSAMEKVRSLLERLCQRLFVIGEDAALANLVKLAANVLTATTLECMGEVLALLRKGGVEGHVGFDVLTNSLFDSRVHKTYGGKIVEGHYSPPGMAVPLAIKDLRLALAEAEHLAVPMPAASLVHDRLVAMMARGWAGLDWSALGLLAAVDAGLEDGR
jgi:3-hydroxyisobutyrate dehydrogenase-like beta-hydroxyacid dehydrogenase